MATAWESTEAHCGATHTAVLRQSGHETTVEVLKGLASSLRACVSSTPLYLRPHIAELLLCVAGLHDEPQQQPPADSCQPLPLVSTPLPTPSPGHKRALDKVTLPSEEEEDEEQEEDDKEGSDDITMVATESLNSRRLRAEWTEKEEAAFLDGLKSHGREWGAVQRLVGTRNRAQLRTHYRYLAETFSRNREREQLGKEPARRVGHRGRPRSEATKRVLGEPSQPAVMTNVMRELGAVILELEAKAPMLGTGVRRRPTRMRVNPVPGEGLMSYQEHVQQQRPFITSTSTASVLALQNSVIPSALPSPAILTSVCSDARATQTKLPTSGLLLALASCMQAQMQ